MIPQTVQEHQAAQADFAKAQEAERQRLLKLVNTAASQLRWRETGAWAVVKAELGLWGSAADMDVEQLERILEHAQKCGFKVRHKQGNGKTSRPLDQARQSRLIRSVWLLMHRLGIVRSADESALGSWLANHRDGRVITDLALLSADEMDRSINRIRAYFCREIRKGVLECPTCGAAFQPTDKQAWAWGQGHIQCDKHAPASLYNWRRTEQASQPRPQRTRRRA